jgi:SsrA-binding protein
MSIIDNKKAFHDYFIEERHEAGLVLEGWEVKAIRAGRAQLKEAYVVLKKEEVWLVGCHISPLPTASTHIKPDPTRSRKLLLHAQEIRKLIGKVQQAGFTLVPSTCTTPRAGSRSRSDWPRARSSMTSAPRKRNATGSGRSSAVRRDA